MKDLKDHEIRELVNELTAVAKVYHGHQSLRERISHVVNDALKPKPVMSEPKPPIAA